MNKVFLQGRITSDFNKFGGEETPGLRFSLVTSKPKYNDGQIVRNAQGYAETWDAFHTIVAFNGKAKALAKTKKKGDMVTLVGEIRYSKNEHEGRTYYNTEIHVEEVHLG